MAKSSDLSDRPSNQGRHVKRKRGLTRTKTGCLTCRKRRKKCDGEVPLCGHCERLRLDCAWPDFVDERRNSGPRKSASSTNACTTAATTASPDSEANAKDVDVTKQVLPSGELFHLYASPQAFTQADLEAARWLESHKSEHRGYLTTSDTTQLQRYDPIDTTKHADEELFELEDEFVMYPEQLSRSFVFDTPFASLDHDMKILIDYFETEFAPLISVGPRRTNNLLRVFLPMAATNEAVLTSIAGWSATHLRDIDEKFRDQSTTLMGRAINKLESLSEDEAERDKDTTLAVALICCAVEVCKDTDSDWAIYKDMAYDIIQRRDLIRRYSGNDQAFLLLNYAYHNTLASNIPLIEETTLPGLETQQILRTVPTIGGPDCYLGICAPMYCLISEVTTLRARIYLEDLGQRAVAMWATRMIVAIDSCNPHPSDLEYLLDDERTQHLDIWKILKLVAKLYLNQVILRYPPCNSSSQVIIEQLIPLFTSLKTVLAEMLFPLFIIGVDALGDTRTHVGRMMESCYERFRIGNVRLAYTLLEKCWECNHDGRVFVDWNEVSNATFGQVLSFA